MRLLATSSLILAAACARPTPGTIASPDVPLAITGVTVVDVLGGPSRPGTTVLVRANVRRIRAVVLRGRLLDRAALDGLVR